MIKFNIKNYRGGLVAKENKGLYFWAVDCEIHGAEWEEITEKLYMALLEKNGGNDRQF